MEDAQAHSKVVFYIKVAVHLILMTTVVGAAVYLRNMQSDTASREDMYVFLKTRINPVGFYINPDTVASEIPAITHLIRGACDFDRTATCIIHAYVSDFENRGLVHHAHAFYESSYNLKHTYGFDINVYFIKQKTKSGDWVDLGRLSVLIFRINK